MPFAAADDAAAIAFVIRILLLCKNNFPFNIRFVYIFSALNIVVLVHRIEYAVCVVYGVCCVYRRAKKNEREYCPSFALYISVYQCWRWPPIDFINVSISPALLDENDIGNGARHTRSSFISHSHPRPYTSCWHDGFCIACHPTATDNEGKSLPLPWPLSLLLPSTSSSSSSPSLSSSPSPSSSTQQSRRNKVIKIRNMFLLFWFYSLRQLSRSFFYTFLQNEMFIKKWFLARWKWMP